MDFDNVGLLVGKSDSEVRRVLTELDITDAVIEEAREIGAELIVSHHPLFFSVKSITNADPTGRRIMTLIENGIAAICMHTNLDAADEGVNAALAEAIGVKEPKLLRVEGAEGGVPYGIARFGELEEETDLVSFLEHVKCATGAAGLRYTDAGRTVKRVAFCGGSGGDYLEDAVRAGCDTFLTADVKHHVFLASLDHGINLIDGGHFCTENVVVPYLREKLAAAFPTVEITVSSQHRQPERFI